jgi:hypothetical protein
MKRERSREQSSGTERPRIHGVGFGIHGLTERRRHLDVLWLASIFGPKVN